MCMCWHGGGWVCVKRLVRGRVGGRGGMGGEGRGRTARGGSSHNTTAQRLRLTHVPPLGL